MRPIHAPKSRIQLRRRRHLRVRRKVAGTAERPRLVVFRSLKHIYAQLVDDDRGVTLFGVGDGAEVQRVETKVHSDLDQSVLPKAPLTVGPGYARNPAAVE